MDRRSAPWTQRAVWRLEAAAFDLFTALVSR